MTAAARPPATESDDSCIRGIPRWQQLAIEYLPGSLGRLLDYGCGPCGLLDRLRHRASECHGVDVDGEKIEAAAKRFPDFHLHQIDLTGQAPYPDAYFDTVAAVEVIEHVPDERRTLAELARLLKPGGRLLLTTPHRGWLTFMDPGNFKFLFPRVHRFIHLHIRRNRDYYRRRFEGGADKGLAGDISLGERPPWHRHYRPEEILSLCPPDLTLVQSAVYFPGMRALMTARHVLHICTGGWIRTLSWPLSPWEERLSQTQTRGGDQLVMLFRKEAAEPR